jgi:hypothetical protein
LPVKDREELNLRMTEIEALLSDLEIS